MRITLTLAPDVARLLTGEARRQRKPFVKVVNEAIRKGLAPSSARGSQEVFRVQPHGTTLRHGIDVASLNKVADEFEDDAVIEQMRVAADSLTSMQRARPLA